MHPQTINIRFDRANDAIDRWAEHNFDLLNLRLSAGAISVEDYEICVDIICARVKERFEAISVQRAAALDALYI